MDLTICGSQASYSIEGRANPAYLITEDDTNILLDIGNGSLSHLFSVMDPAKLDAVIISHLHIDHFGDIFPLRLYLYFEKKKKIRLYLPAGGKEKLGGVLSEHGRDIFNEAFDFIEIAEGVYKEGGISVEFKKVRHLEPTFGIKLTGDGKTIVYSADTELCPELIELSKDADVLLAEATFQERLPVSHMTADDAGELAYKADCEKLILTHIWPSLDSEASRKAAAQYFNGPIGIAREGDVFRI
jgi:ribonuclease BN (tRNA processing enzyme)